MKLSQEEFDIIKNRLVQWQWLKETYNYKKDKFVYKLSDCGLVYYVTALILLDTNRLFKGPVIPHDTIDKFKKTFTVYHNAINFLTKDHSFLHKIIDDGEKWALSKDGAELFYVFMKLTCCKVKSNSDTVIKRLTLIILNTLAVSSLAAGKIITDETDKHVKKKLNTGKRRSK